MLGAYTCCKRKRSVLPPQWASAVGWLARLMHEKDVDSTLDPHRSGATDPCGLRLGP